MDELLIQRLRKRKKRLATTSLILLVIAAGLTFASLWYAPLKPYLLPAWVAMLVYFFAAKRLQKLEKQVPK